MSGAISFLSIANELGVHEGPTGADGWARSVYRKPPPNFTIEMQPPVKTGRFYLYCMKIHSLVDSPTSASTSVSARTISGGYTIWREWEDVLHFQDWIETEYKHMARLKKKKLLSGKRVKTEKSIDDAASFVSLPNGPDPKSIPVNVHHYLPVIPKKASLIAESQEVALERNESIKHFLQALFAPDLPTLLEEIHANEDLLSFFSYWRKDVEYTRKRAKRKEKEAEMLRRASAPESAKSIKPAKSLASYFSGRSSASSIMSFSTNSIKSSVRSELSSSDTLVPEGFRRLSRDSDSDRSSSGSTSSYGSVASLPISPVERLASNPSIVGEGQSPVFTDPFSSRRIDDDISESVASLKFAEKLQEGDERKSRRLSGESTMSWQSTTSFAESIPEEYMDQMNRFIFTGKNRVSSIMLDPAPPRNARARDSIASFATVRTECSADAIVPSPTSYRTLNRNSWSTISSDDSSLFPSELGHNFVYNESPLTPGPNGAFPQDTVDTFDVYDTESSDVATPVSSRFPNRPSSIYSVASTTSSFSIGSRMSGSYGVIDTVLEERSNGSRCATPTGDLPSSMTIPGAEHLPTFLQPRTPHTPKTPYSASSNVAMPSTPSPFLPSFSHQIPITAIHNSTIMSFNIERNLTFKELREIVLYKFDSDEVKLSNSFAVAWLPNATMSADGNPLFEEMKFIRTEAAWLNAVTKNGCEKMTLKAIGDEAV